MFAGLIAFGGCSKDNDLEKKYDELEGRVSVLEAKVKELNEQTVPGMAAIIAALQGNVYVTEVSPTEGGVFIKFSDGTSATIKDGAKGDKGDKGDTFTYDDLTDAQKDALKGDKGDPGDKGDKGDVPVIGAKEIDGEFYWTANGELMLDENGKPIPVHAALPIFKIIEGKWQVSYDNGATWTEVPQMGQSDALPISIEDGEETVTFYIGDTPYVINKEVAFYLVFAEREGLGVAEGQTSSFPYTIKGVKDEDEVEVDVLNVIGTWTAEAVATDNKSGNINVTNNGGSAKVFVYAANGRGKTDIKSLVFEGGVLTATVSAESVSYEGGNIELSVTTNMNYDIEISEEATWLTVAPETKATHTDVITLVAEANTTASARTATVKVAGDGITKEFEIIQEAAPANYQIDITVENITTTTADITFTPNDEEVHYMIAVETPGWVESFGSLEELAAGDIEYWLDYYGEDYNEDPDFYNSYFGISSLEELIYELLASPGEYSDTFEDLDPGQKYYAYAFCIDEKLNVISDVFIKDFTTLTQSSSAKYEDYLGRWKMGNDFIEITAKTNGSTYNVTGIKNQSTYAIGPVEASFEGGLFVLKEQKTDATTVVNVTGLGELNCDLYLSGVFAYGTSTYGNYPINGDDPEVIFTGAYENGTISVTPGSCNYGKFATMGFSWVIKEGANAGNGNTYAGTSLVNMTKPEAAKPEYTKWIGNYTFNINGTSYNATVSELDANSSFIISFDDEYIKGFDATVIWNESTDTATLSTQTLGSWNHSSYGTITDIICGLIPYNGSFTSVTGDYIIANIAYDGGNLNFTSGGTVSIQGLGTLNVVGFSLFGKASAGSLRYVDYEDMIYFPFTLTKAAGTKKNSVESTPVMSKAESAKRIATSLSEKAEVSSRIAVINRKARKI